MNENNKPWFTENWYDEDLEAVLDGEEIPVNAENIQRLKEACEGIFNDKSWRFEMLAVKAREVFGRRC